MRSAPLGVLLVMGCSGRDDPPGGDTVPDGSGLDTSGWNDDETEPTWPLDPADTHCADPGAIRVPSVTEGTHAGSDVAAGRLVGDIAGVLSGRYVAFAGDTDGDGFATLAVSAPTHPEGILSGGAVFAVEGPICGDDTLLHADLRLDGGWSLHRAVPLGDFDGDGRDDVGLSDSNASADPNALVGTGRVYLWSGADLQNGVHAVESRAVAIFQASGPDRFSQVAAPGDVNGDGVQDLLLGGHGWTDAYREGPNEWNKGRVHLIHGPFQGVRDLDLEPADAVFVGVHGHQALGKVAPGGDLSGDGLPDLVMTAPGPGVDDGADEDGDGYDIQELPGSVYIFLSPNVGAHTVEDADYTLNGEESADWAGIGLAGGSDVDGDTIPDLLIGAPRAEGPTSSPGRIYLVTGLPDAATTRIDEAASAILEAEGVDGYFGQSLAHAGDLDQDGFGDILVGAAYGPGASGVAYVVYGPIAGLLDIADADIKLMGSQAAGFGVSVAGGGDLNADGYPDFAIGESGNSEVLPGAGMTYIFYGGPR